jgi:hypothetical protein
VTALAGQVLRLEGEPLASVKLEVEKHLTLRAASSSHGGQQLGRCTLTLESSSGCDPATKKVIGELAELSATTALPIATWFWPHCTIRMPFSANPHRS